MSTKHVLCADLNTFEHTINLLKYLWLSMLIADPIE